MTIEPIGAGMARENSVTDGVLPILLAGGQGSRLHELTADTCKPAVPFVGETRIVDFTLQNLALSGQRAVLVATQYRAEPLGDHLRQRWSDRILMGLRHAPDIAKATGGARGTADAVRMLIPEIDAARPRDVLILAADHVYRMDYRDMLADHRRSEADVTVAVDLVPRAEAHAFGVLDTDRVGRITHFLEKPRVPPKAPGHPGRSLASMGLYLFRWNVLRKALLDHEDAVDFGHDVLPDAILNGRAFAHAPGSTRAFYWRDVGTLDALRRAALDFMGDTPPFALPCGTRNRRSDLLDTLVMDGAFVSRGSLLHNCIVAPGTIVPFGVEIGTGHATDMTVYRRDTEGTWLVTADMLRRGNPNSPRALSVGS